MFDGGIDHCILAVDVNMPVEKYGRLKNIDQPAKGFNALVRPVILVVNFPRWGMCHEHIQVTPIADAV